VNLRLLVTIDDGDDHRSNAIDSIFLISSALTAAVNLSEEQAILPRQGSGMYCSEKVVRSMV